MFGDTIRLTNGVVLPKFSCIAVPLLGDYQPQGRRATPSQNNDPVWMDMQTGALKKAQRPSQRVLMPRTGQPKGVTSTYNVDNFSGDVDVRKVLNDWHSVNIVASSGQDAVVEVDPGYFDQVPATIRFRSNTTTIVAADDYSNGSFSLSSNYKIKDVVVNAGKPLTISTTDKLTITNNLRYIAVNVLERVNEANPWIAELQGDRNLGYSDAPIVFAVHTGYTPPQFLTAYEGSRFGLVVRITTSGTSEDVYKKAIDLAIKLPFDFISLDYYSGGPTLITIGATVNSVRGRIQTTFDDSVVSYTSFLHVIKNRQVYDNMLTPSSTGTFAFDPTDDYSALVHLVSNTTLFSGRGAELANTIFNSVFHARANGGIVQANTSANTDTEDDSGSIPSAGGGQTGNTQGGGSAGMQGVEQALAALSTVMQCPTPGRNTSMFPIASHPSLRHLSDSSQLDDAADTQNTIAYNLRTNNPLGVPVQKGVTDLKTRYGFLGESKGKAVYRDHIGGAAAGLAYLQSMGGGQSVQQAVSSVMGGVLSSTAGSTNDLTAMSPGSMFQNMSRDLFGQMDPTGTILGCSTIMASSNSASQGGQQQSGMDQLLHTAASMAKNQNALQKSPLTYDEWASAYQIMKNEKNEHMKKTTTGVDLPAQEKDDEKVQDTGVQTERQAKHTNYSEDYEKRLKKEKWNPLNFGEFKKRWDDETQWMTKGLVKYEQKASKDDKLKMAKKEETEDMSGQDSTHPSNVSMLPWTAT